MASSDCRCGNPKPSPTLLRTHWRLAPSQEAQRAEIDALVCALERQTTLQAPTEQLASLAGDWRLLYTTARGAFLALAAPLPRAHATSRSTQLSIRGGTRTKLGLRGALTLGELTQRIVCDADSPSTGRATNCVQFSLVGALSGSFTVDASYAVASPQRCVRSHRGGMRGGTDWRRLGWTSTSWTAPWSRSSCRLCLARRCRCCCRCSTRKDGACCSTAWRGSCAERAGAGWRSPMWTSSSEWAATTRACSSCLKDSLRQRREARMRTKPR